MSSQRFFSKRDSGPKIESLHIAHTRRLFILQLLSRIEFRTVVANEVRRSAILLRVPVFDASKLALRRNFHALLSKFSRAIRNR